jgi:hypothetical protein
MAAAMMISSQSRANMTEAIRSDHPAGSFAAYAPKTKSACDVNADHLGMAGSFRV